MKTFYIPVVYLSVYRTILKTVQYKVRTVPFTVYWYRGFYTFLQKGLYIIPFFIHCI
jgi:hypothetical protein